MSAVYVNEEKPNIKGIRLANACISRKINLPANWTTLGVGILCNLTTGSRANMSSPRFTLGLSAGTASIGDPYIPHFFGMRTGTSGAHSMNWASSSTSYYSLTVMSEYKIINNTASYGSDMEAATTYWHTNEDTTNNRQVILYWYVSRAGTTYTTKYFRPTVTTAFTGSSEETFKSAIQAVAPTVTDHSYSNNANETIDEATNGVFDHVNVAWDRETPEAELIVYDIGVSVLE